MLLSLAYICPKCSSQKLDIPEVQLLANVYIYLHMFHELSDKYLFPLARRDIVVEVVDAQFDRAPAM